MAKITPRATVATPTEKMSVTIRKISNGFIVNQSGYRGDTYVNKEIFSPTNPLAKPVKK